MSRWDALLLGNVVDVDRWRFCERCGKPLQAIVEGRFDAETGKPMDGVVRKYCPAAHVLVALSATGPRLP